MRLCRQWLFLVLIVVSCSAVLAPRLQAEVLKGQAPIIVTLMTHTDGPYRNVDAFNREKDRLIWGMDLYGDDVKMNLEVSMEFAAFDVRGGFLDTVVTRGHGVGTHCNNVPFEGIASTADLTNLIVQNRDAVNVKLTESTVNVSISGICTQQNWVGAAADALYKIADGTVAYCYLPMPAAARPRGLTDALIKSTYFHESAPFGFHKRISPIRLQNADDFAADSPGVLTLSNGGLGELASLDESRILCGTSCVLDAADFEVVYAAIETVKALKGPRDVGRINIHVPTKLMVESNRLLLTGFLNRLRLYAAANTIAFGTELDVLQTFEYWQP